MRALVALVLFSVGCSAQGLPTSYHVMIDPSVSPDVAQSVLDAVQDWRAHVELEISVVSGRCSLAEDGYGSVCVISDAGPSPLGSDVEATTLQNGYGSAVQLWPDDWRTDIPARVIAHELGHAMGLVHTGPGTLMCASSDCAAVTITDADVAQWLALR
jgi:hypothetical protein